MPRSLKRKKMLEKMEQLNTLKRQRREEQQPPQPDGEAQITTHVQQAPAGTSGDPQPGTSGDPQPGTSGEPQPGTSGEPQPGTSREELSPAMVKRSLREKVRPGKDNIRPSYMLVEKACFLNPRTKCKKCGSHLEDRNVLNRYGAAYQISETCQVCGEETKHWTSHRQLPTGVFDVNVKLVEFALANLGYKTIQDMEAFFESKLLTSTRFFEIAKKIEEEGIEECEEKLKTARQLIHHYLKQLDPDAPQIKNVAVTCDGSWSKRGFMSKFGVVIVIHQLTGLVIDFELLSKHCAFCAKHASDESDWYEDHMDDCNKNFAGSSPAMEAEGWMRLFRRSVEKCRMRYVTVISDGDSKAYNSVENENIYGDLHITKEECINHVAKRLGKLLRDYAQEKSKKGEGVGGKRAGSLTTSVMAKLQEYYRYAIVNNKRDTSKMRQAIYATLEHCSSTNEAPHHDLCPEGKTSWCFYQRLLAEGKDVKGAEGNHQRCIHTPLRRDIAEDLMPLYERLSTEALLKRCTGYTQNANESINSVIWSKASKTVFYQRKRLEYLVSKGITQFNLGYQHSVTTKMGPVGLKTTASIDKEREAKAKREESRKQERRTRRTKALAEEEKKKQEEGTTYEAGGF